LNNLSGDAVQHLVPVMEIVGLMVIILLAVIGGLWKGFRWLDGRMDDKFVEQTRSEAFEKVITHVVERAAAGWADVNNRLHNEHSQRLSGLERRDEERAQSISRLHGRVDEAWVKLAEVNARVPPRQS
jgi:DNA-binding GntR family transcriptional regulator